MEVPAIWYALSASALNRSISVGVLMHDLASLTDASSNNSLRNDLWKQNIRFKYKVIYIEKRTKLIIYALMYTNSKIPD